MGSEHTQLRFEAERTLLSPAGSPEVVIGVGIDRLADDLFLHEPPSPAELERAIEVVEDALMATGLPHLQRGELTTAEPLLQALMGGARGSTRTTLVEVEAQFQQLAAISLGSRERLPDPAFTRSAAAALLILRELMHHLGYRAVSVGGGGGPSGGR